MAYFLQSACQAPFDSEQCKRALGSAGAYEAAGNVFWVNMRYNAAAGVPINQQAVAALQKQFFQTATHKYPFIITVAVDAVDADVQNDFGNLRRVSPEEGEHALLLRIAQDINEGANEATLRVWKACLLSATMSFEILTSEDDRYWRSVNLREGITGQFEAMARTPMQRCFELISFKLRKEQSTGVRLSAKDLEKAWCKNAKMASSSEAVTESFCDTAVKVYNTILSKEQLRVIVASCDGFKRSPFDSIYKLEAVINKTRSSDTYMCWCLAYIAESVLVGLADAGEFSIRNLTGKGMGNKGCLDLFMMKKDLLDYILGEFLDSNGFTMSVKRQACELTTWAVFKAKSGKFEKGSDLTWMGLLPESGRLLISLIEDALVSRVLLQLKHLLPQHFANAFCCF